jgi:two-component system sensor histidine kinase/response regulator
MPLTVEPHDLALIATKAAERFRPVLGKRKLTCNVPQEANLVPCDGTVVRRIVENLINNSIKFTRSNGTIHLDVQSDSPGDITVSVKDNGYGIPGDKHEHIFDKFGQLNGGGERHSTGLGLTFCKLAVEAHGGTIGVKSAPDQGSMFWFTMPRAVEAAVSSAQALRFPEAIRA